MPTIQSQFIKFHDTIKLDADDKKVLIDKRTEVEEAINKGVSEFGKSFFNQGSYSTHTGILPIDEGDYDLDRGLKIDADRYSYSPKEVKNFIFDALVSEFGENRVKVKNPCVTVSFPEDSVHIDIAVYCTENDNYFLARGKLNSTDENIKWEEADPVELTKKINNAMENSEDRNQFRRVIRYLKRWKDLKFKNQDNRPTGIGISVFAVNNFSVSKKVDYLSGNTTYDDISALRNLENTMINSFSNTYDVDRNLFYPRLEVFLPVKPYTDVYERVSNIQMEAFKNKLEKLRDSLDEAIDSTDLSESTKILSKQFGDDFPVIEQKETAENFGTRAIISDYPSA